MFTLLFNKISWRKHAANTTAPTNANVDAAPVCQANASAPAAGKAKVELAPARQVTISFPYIFL